VHIRLRVCGSGTEIFNTPPFRFTEESKDFPPGTSNVSSVSFPETCCPLLKVPVKEPVSE